MYPVLFLNFWMVIFGATKVTKHLGCDLDLRKRLGVVRDLVAIDEQHRGELDVAILVSRDAVENNDRANLDLLLPTTGAHNYVSHL